LVILVLRAFLYEGDNNAHRNKIFET
jgi:hypothetical protein